jgi:hypothetical protein
MHIPVFVSLTKHLVCVILVRLGTIDRPPIVTGDKRNTRGRKWTRSEDRHPIDVERPAVDSSLCSNGCEGSVRHDTQCNAELDYDGLAKSNSMTPDPAFPKHPRSYDVCSSWKVQAK